MTKLNLGLTLIFLLILCVAPAANARGRRTIDDNDRVTLHRNVHKKARGEFDVGATDPSLRMERMVLALRPSDQQQAALAQLVAEQQDPESANYHRWLSPEEFGTRFGPSSEDLATVTEWLTSQGFTIDEVAKGRTWINFSGRVDRVERAFRTRMRNFRVNGTTRSANALDPSIPRGLSGLVAGVSTLHNFPRKPMHSSLRREDAAADPAYTSSGGSHSLAPGDFAAIYNLNPLYAAGTDGTGQTIAIVGRTHPPASNWSYFRSSFGLSANPPQVVVNGADPGDLGSDEDGEADLDVEWSGAVAKNASIQFVVSRSTFSTDGVDLSAQYIVNHNLAPVMSVSFGQCESEMGTSENAFFNNLWAQAAAQGISVFVSSGDSGAAGCDNPSSGSGTGRGVNGLASTPYNVAVGGTEFYEGTGSYWNASNGVAGVSALGYIPETTWNESGLATAYCPSDTAPCSELWSTGGGASAIYAKPSWQQGGGVPNDARRDVPDVSLSSALHDGYRVRSGGIWSRFGGTSAASPALAGIMALVVQKTGQRQGNPNPRFYQMANEQAAGGLAVFHDITTGNNSVPGVVGYAAGTGYDLSTGLGSVNAALLVDNFAPLPAVAACGASNGAYFNLAPASALCSSGTAGPVSGSGPWNWSCTVGGGTPASCSALSDTSAPILSVSTLADNSTTSDPTLNVSGSVRDAGAGVRALTLNGQVVAFSADGSFSALLTLGDGANTLTVAATDNAGNAALSQRTIYLDRTAPVLRVLQPADNSVTAQSGLELTGTLDDPDALVTVRTNNGTPAAANKAGTGFTASLNLVAGPNTIDITATDRAGNSSTLKRSITFDNSAPALSVAYPVQDISTVRDSVTLTGSVSDSYSGVTVSIFVNGRTWAPLVAGDGSFSQVIDLPTNTTYAVVVTATDRAGNAATVQRNIAKIAPLLGDLDGDGVVGMGDALIALRISVGIQAASAEDLRRGDVAPLSQGAPAPDGTIDLADALILLKKTVGLVAW
jgi:pseudomonalisin